MNNFVDMAYMQLAQSIGQDAQNRRDNKAATLAERQLTDAISAEYKVLNSNLAYTLALRAALEGFLEKLLTDANGKRPNVALLDDMDLREKIGEAGRTAFNLAEGDRENGWDSAKATGRSFKLDPPPNLFVNHVPVHLFNERTAVCNERGEKVHELRLTVADLNQKLVDANSQIAVLTRAVDMLNNSQASSAELEASKVEAENARRENETLIKNCAQHMAQSHAFRAQLAEVDPTNPLLIDSALRQRVSDVAYERLAATDFKDWSVVKEVGSTFVSTTERRRSSSQSS